MKRNRGILIIGLCLILIIFLAGVLVKGTNEGIGTAVGVLNLNAKSTKLSEENQYSHELEEIENIKLDVTVDDILIEQSDNNEIKIIEKSNYKLEESEKLQIIKNGDTLEIVRNDKNVLLKRNTINRKLEIYLPKNYNGSLILENTVGDIKINSDLKLDKFDTKQKVGDLKLDSKIECSTFSFKNTTGDIDIKNIKGNGTIEGNVGDIKCYLEELTGDVYIQTTTGDIGVLINEDNSFILDTKYNIGELDTNIKLNNASSSKKSLSGTYGYDTSNTLIVEGNVGDISIDIK